MDLKTLFDSMSEEQRNIQLGFDTATPLTHAFTSKRAVHAGLSGRPLEKEEAQRVWNELMQQPPTPGQMQTAYIHIPFCQTKCTYCGFYQHATNQDAEDRYVDMLLKEIQMAADQPRFRDGLIHTIFIGGGTPTSLSAHNAKRMLAAIQQYFPLANDYELTLEGRIHDLVPEKMDVWMSHGVNRMSLGVQSFHTHVRRQLGRLDDQDTVLSRLEQLKAYQQCSVIVDLIYGLPDQTMDVWMEDLKLLEQSAADGMDLYQLNVFENSDLQSLIERGKVSPAATTKEQALMYEAAVKYLMKRDFTRLSAAHWSRAPRERSMYNTMAKAGYPMYPFGCGAGGNLGGYMTMLHRVLPPYEALVEEGKKPFMVLMKQSELQEFSNYVISSLERGVLNLDALIEMDPKLEDLRWLLDTWVTRGLMEYNGVLYRLTTAGGFWHVNITQTVIECVQYILTGESTLLHENIAAQNHGGRPKDHPHVGGGHPEGVAKHPHGSGGHPAGVPKGHPEGVPMGGHPAGVPKHPHGAGGHPAGIPKGHPEGVPMGGHPAGVPKHPHGAGGHPAGIPKGYPGDVETTRAHGTVGHSPFKKNI